MVKQDLTELATRNLERAMQVVEDGADVMRTTLDKGIGAGLRSGDRRGNGQGEGAERERGESGYLHEGEHVKQGSVLTVEVG
jgi:hypothetical protein